MAKKPTQSINLAKTDETCFMQQNHCIIPDALQQTILSVHGTVGKRWLNQLPNLLKSLVKQWNFKIEKTCANLSFNFVVLVVLEDGNKAVLKCGIPDCEFKNEINALQCYAGEGTVKLIAADAKKG